MRFSVHLAERLELEPKYICPGYEDVWHYLWKERRLPTNVDPLKSNLKDPLERERLARVFEQGLEQVIGYALPLERGFVKGNPGWVSGPTSRGSRRSGSGVLREPQGSPASTTTWRGIRTRSACC